MPAADNELFGEWWLPPDRSRIPGRLLLADDGFRLQLSSNPLPAAPLGFAVRVLHGDAQGRPLSLFDGQETSRDFGGQRPFREVITFDRVVLGDHLDRWNQAVFREIQIAASSIPDFVGVSGLSLEDIPPRRGEVRRHRVEWSEVPEPAASVQRVRVAFKSDSDFQYASHYEFRLHHRAWISLRSSRPLSLATWDAKWITDLLSLVALGCDDPPSLDHWLAWHMPLGQGTPRGRTVEILVRRRPSFPRQTWRTRLHSPFLTLNDVGDQVPTLLRGFHSFRREHPQAAELLLEHQLLEGALTPADRFLYMARFLESFHRSRGARQASTFQRVLQLIAGPGTLAKPYLGASPREVAELTKDTRNYYVHYNAQDESRAVHDLQLDDLADRLWFLVRSCLLDEIGLTDEVIEAALARDPRAERLEETKLPRPRPRRRPR